MIREMRQVVFKAFICCVICLMASQKVTAGITEVPITMLNNRPAVYIRINNSEKMLVILDTGFGGNLMLEDSIAKSLNLKHLRTRTINNMGMGELTLEDYGQTNVQFGDVSIPFASITADKNLSRMLSRLGTDQAGTAPVGILSAWAISKGTIGFNLSENKVVLDTGATLDINDPSVIPYAFGSGLPTFEISINGKNYTTHLDSGSPSEIMMPSRFMSDFKYIKEPEERGGAQTAGRSHKMWRAQIKGAVQFGNVNISDSKVLFIEGIPAMNVGLKLFGAGTVSIDASNHLIKFDKK